MLLPGSERSYYVGRGPTADFRKEHLEVNALSGKNKGLVGGRTLHRLGKSMEALLKKVGPIVADYLTLMEHFHQAQVVRRFFANLPQRLRSLLPKGSFLLLVMMMRITIRQMWLLLQLKELALSP
jgi:hypothetical protein